MRFPFDLIAAVTCVGEISRYLARIYGTTLWINPGAALLAWGGFILAAWLLAEWVARQTEWRTRFGLHPAGLPGRKHPLVAHTWELRATQFLVVVLYAVILFDLKWPLFVQTWPQWFGLSQDTALGRLPLAESSLISLFLNLAPFLAAMVFSWLPRRRLMAGMRKRTVPLFSFLALEAKLTWIPLLLALLISVFEDTLQALPAHYSAWMDSALVQLLLGVGIILFIAVLGFPWLMIRLWRCRPLPDGELKSRLQALMARSGVRARSILVWGSRSSGLLNACVLGPWARFRYVLISPALADELSVEETEAVLAHELGHARYGHLTFYFVIILCLSALMEPLSRVLSLGWHGSPIFQSGAMMAFVIVYIFCFFGSISRQCEREADLASAELLGTPFPLVMALEKLALITGNIRNVYCWNHGSIAQRVAEVQRLSFNPEAGARLHARLRRLRIIFTTLTLAAIGVELLVLLAQ